ncbi:MAG: xanthine dehydrogenase family protein molybdopterin-binding subunit [Alphaproteobacteria bacterium]|nr:xanthine dehydrogenase family protein molybdopterin-binding subunit [Alphaproteobacteria bacterium]
MDSSNQGYIGRSVTRLEDRPLVTGAGRFVADIDFSHQLHMRVVRSAHAHGIIRSIDLDAAKAMLGVRAIWTFTDIADIPPIPFRATTVQGLEPYRQPILADEFVRYVGEPVAAVFADNAFIAEDAAELVSVDIEERPPVLSAQHDPGEFAPGLGTEPTTIVKTYGDLDAAMAQAHGSIALTLEVGRHSGVPLETRGAVARYDAATDMLELHGAAKRPHWNRDQIAEMIQRAPSSIQLFEYHVGGGFGVRGEIYPEDILVCLAALRLRRPVKWVEDRREHLMATNHSREQTHLIRAGFDADGRILAIDNEFYHDQGAYVRTHGARVVDMTTSLLPGPYRIPAYRAVGHFRLTNKTPAATYRAPGRFETSFVRERVVDAVAAQLGIDPVEIRRRNLISKDEMPFARPMDALDTPVEFDSGDYAGLLDKALTAFDWNARRADIERRRSSGEAVGAGIAMFVEKSGLGPVDTVRVSVDTAGAVEIVTGSSSVGQGMETVIAQICAETLGVDYRNIRVIRGQTNRIEFGFGTHASRVTVMTGEATRVAAEKVKKKALGVAAEMLQISAAALELRDGCVIRQDSETAIPLGDIARNLGPTSRFSREREPGLSADGWHRTDHMTYPYGVHAAVVRVDRETGGVAVENYLVAYDVGRAVNPMLVEGQMLGGLAQGLGGALLEEFRYDEQGTPLSVTFADYMIPTAREMPKVEILITEDAPSPLNPLGLKGAGEGGVNPVGAVIAAAIDDALGMPGAITRLPATPQRLRALMSSAPDRRTARRLAGDGD